MGGGFGSKFGVDRWGVVCAELSRMTGRPVKLMLDRDQEVSVAGARPFHPLRGFGGGGR